MAKKKKVQKKKTTKGKARPESELIKAMKKAAPKRPSTGGVRKKRVFPNGKKTTTTVYTENGRVSAVVNSRGGQNTEADEATKKKIQASADRLAAKRKAAKKKVAKKKVAKKKVTKKKK